MQRFLLVVVSILLGGGLVYAGGCGGGSAALPFRTVADAEAWALSTDQPAYVVVTEKDWRSHYAALPPGADFTNNVYVVASWGTKPNPGYRVSITGLNQSGLRLEVRVKLERPEPNKYYPQVLVRPTAVAEVAAKSLVQRGLLTVEFLDQDGSLLARVEAEL